MTATPEKKAATDVVLTLLGDRLLYPTRQIVDRHYSPVGRINLSGRPLVRVVSVTDQDSQTVPWTVLGNRASLILDRNEYRWNYPSLRHQCGPKDRYVDIEYVAGTDTLPEGVQRAIDTLAGEFLLAYTGKPCRLPQRVTSVSRQGVSWTLLDPQDFLQEGRTGIYEIDLMLSTFNRGGARARTRVFSPEYAPPLRLSETIPPTSP